MEDLGLYIHIPFCQSRCYYCDFLTFSDRDEKIEVYVESLLKEIELYRDRKNKYIVKTIFIGGGTPSYIDQLYIGRIMEKIYECFKVDDEAEISLEANPGTLTEEKLMKYKDLGINRLSFGLQSLDDPILKKIGRIHTSQEFFHNYKLARDLGFKNINVDMMFDLPDQTEEILMDNLRSLVELDPSHISLYSLIFEEGTKISKAYEEGKLSLVDEDQERTMYHSAIEFLGSQGYEHYEISNFAKKDMKSRHNIRYWEIQAYLGLGLGSHSFYEGHRFNNHRDFESYFESIARGDFPLENKYILEKDDEILEYIIMKLRLIEGIDLNYFEERFGVALMDLYKEAVNKNIDRGLLLLEGTSLKFSKRGLDISNQVYLDFMP